MPDYITLAGHQFTTLVPLVEVECTWCGKLFAVETGSSSHQYPQCGACILDRIVPKECGHLTLREPCVVCRELGRLNSD